MSGSDRQAKIAWALRVLGVDLTAMRAQRDLPGFTQRLNAMMPAITAALNGPHGQDIRTKVQQAGALARGGEFIDAARLLTEVEAMLGGTFRSAPSGKGRAQWQSARGSAIISLTALEAAIKTATHPRRDAAIIIVRAIRANLTERPETIEQVKDLESYLITDQIIEVAEKTNKLGVQVALRKPLLAALQALSADLTPGL